MRRAFCCGGALLLSAVLLLTGSGCGKITPGGVDQEDAVRSLNTHLINDDLAAFARAALPPELHAQLKDAWKTGRTRWPLDELPLSARYPGALAALSAENAHAELMAVFDQQLAGAERDLRQSARMLSAFMVQFVQHQTDGLYSEHERAHYSQLIMAAGQWAAAAPLTDRERAGQALDLMIPAARKAGLNHDAAFAEAGIDDALDRIAPVMAAFKQVFTLYGLDLNLLLRQAQVKSFSHDDDQAEVELRYRLGQHDITAVIPVQQIEGRWYVSDFVRHVRELVNVQETNGETPGVVTATHQ